MQSRRQIRRWPRAMGIELSSKLINEYAVRMTDLEGNNMADQPRDMVDMMNGAVPRVKPAWGHLATGAGIGYLAAQQFKKTAEQMQGPYAAQYDYDQEGQQQPIYYYAQPTRTARAAQFVWELIGLMLGLAVIAGIGWVAWKVFW